MGSSEAEAIYITGKETKRTHDGLEEVPHISRTVPRGEDDPLVRELRRHRPSERLYVTRVKVHTASATITVA